MVFAVQADVTALFAAPKLGDALAAAAYHPTDAVVRKLWAQCENIIDRSAQVDVWSQSSSQPNSWPLPHTAVIPCHSLYPAAFESSYQAAQLAAFGPMKGSKKLAHHEKPVPPLVRRGGPRMGHVPCSSHPLATPQSHEPLHVLVTSLADHGSRTCKPLGQVSKLCFAMNNVAFPRVTLYQIILVPARRPSRQQRTASRTRRSRRWRPSRSARSPRWGGSSRSAPPRGRRGWVPRCCRASWRTARQSRTPSRMSPGARCLRVIVHSEMSEARWNCHHSYRRG